MQVTLFPTAQPFVLNRLSLFRPPSWRFCRLASFAFLVFRTAHRCGFAPRTGADLIGICRLKNARQYPCTTTTTMPSPSAQVCLHAWLHASIHAIATSGERAPSSTASLPVVRAQPRAFCMLSHAFMNERLKSCTPSCTFMHVHARSCTFIRRAFRMLSECIRNAFQKHSECFRKAFGSISIV